jgi:hypothetical protein
MTRGRHATQGRLVAAFCFGIAACTLNPVSSLSK